MDSELSGLNDISKHHFGKGISAMDSSLDIITGRPHGGLAILWRRSLGSCCKVLTFKDEHRVMGIEVNTGGNKILLLNVYLPCSNRDNLPQFQFYLAKINDLIESHDSPFVLATGDFNADLTSHRNHLFGSELLNFCKDEGLVISDQIHLNNTAQPYTFVSNHGTTSWLDHVVSSFCGHALIKDISILGDKISSDHLPLKISLDIAVSKTLQSHPTKPAVKVNWESVTEEDIITYKENTISHLSKVHLNHNLILCDDIKCTDVSHTAAIDNMYREITDALKDSSEFLLKQTKYKHNQIPGWNDLVKDAHHKARTSYLFWRSNGSLRHGVIYQEMKTSRAQFKLALRQCRKDKTRREADAIANHFLTKDSKTFWSAVKNMLGNNSSAPASVIEGVSGTEAICHMWKTHYQGLLNSSSDMSKRSEVLCALDQYDRSDIIERITPSDVGRAIKSVKKGKTCGPDGLSGEHLVYCNDKLNCLLSILFNCILIHSHLPADFMLSFIVPLVKDKKGDITSKDNYRPIALTNILSKVLELIILVRCETYLETSHNQFGYKKGLGTEMCIFTFKEIVNYYRSLSSNIYVCFMDASKAFDRVNHFHLFDKLLSRGMPKLIVRLLLTWYQTQHFATKWCNHVSSYFTVTNGVRQGSVLSPHLFNAFTDDLSTLLNRSNIGCYLNNVSFNHMQYADDAVLVSPSPNGLQKLLKICENFANTNDMLFNTKKTVCMCVKHKSNVNIRIPEIFLNDKTLKWISEFKYLGVVISDCMKDDRDIKRQQRAIYTRGNILIRKLKACSDDIKSSLFRSFCSSAYCCSLWDKHNESSFNNICVAYNNVYRHFLNIKGACSISNLYVSSNIDSFKTLRRKAVFSLLSRLTRCNNLLVFTLYNSSYATFKSNLLKKWYNLLH